MATINEPSSDDYDSPWKEAMVLYLRDFFEFFFPHIADDIDWTKPPVFLDTKLRQMERKPGCLPLLRFRLSKTQVFPTA